MKPFQKITIGVVSALAAIGTAGAQEPISASTLLKQQLGRLLFFDERLSEPAGQSCSSCHQPSAGFNGDGNSKNAVISGAVANRFGPRNPPSAAYAFGSPRPNYYYVDGEFLYMGGQFWDGRAADLIEQAKAPFLNPVEMNNPSKASVVSKVCGGVYGLLFRGVYGFQICESNNIERAYDSIADAIAAFETSRAVNSFSSKYDLFLKGKVQLTPMERRGLALFEGKALCSQCHPSGAESPFTDFSYDNIGIPKNPDNPIYRTNPSFVDYGLGARLGPAEDGKFKVSSLRNIAIAPPYGHNGFFKSLKQIVHFYNTRDVDSDWPKPEVEQNVNRDELGNLGLTDVDENAIVAFLKTLTDHFSDK
jgi:cytochrome c peroxidase